MPKFLPEIGARLKKSNPVVPGAYLALLIFAIIAPFFIGRYYVGILTLICIYGILSVAFNIAYGFCGMMTFSAGAIFGVSAYTCGMLISLANIPTFLAMICGVVAAGLVSFIISLASYKVSGTYLTLVSYGLLEIIQRLIIEGYDYTGGTSGLHIPKWSIFGAVLDRNQMFYIILICFVIVLFIQKNIRHSQWGRDFIAIKDNPIAAGSVGVCPPRLRVIGFLISSLITGVAGVLYVNYTSFISPETFGFNTSVLILLMVLAGGKGTLFGPIIGTAVIYLIPMIFNGYPDIKQLFYGVMLIVLIQVCPKGICGVVKDYIDKHRQKRKTDYYESNNLMDFSKYKVENSDTDDVLVVKNLSKYYGGLAACNNIDLIVKRGTIHSLIGPNGAGKTTFINNITGVEVPSSGNIFFEGKSITGKKPWNISKLGVSRTYQHVRIMPTLSVRDNVVLGARLNEQYGFFDALFQTGKKKRVDKNTICDAVECLNLIGLGDKQNEKPDNLSSGQQKLLELCRALVARPKFMVLDEPCAGLTETETKQFAFIMKKIRDTGISMLLVEHHMSLIMEVSDYITVIDHGTKIAEGLPNDVVNNPIVRRSYLGE